MHLKKQLFPVSSKAGSKKLGFLRSLSKLSENCKSIYANALAKINFEYPFQYTVSIKKISIPVYDPGVSEVDTKKRSSS